MTFTRRKLLQHGDAADSSPDSLLRKLQGLAWQQVHQQLHYFCPYLSGAAAALPAPQQGCVQLHGKWKPGSTCNREHDCERSGVQPGVS